MIRRKKRRTGRIKIYKDNRGNLHRIKIVKYRKQGKLRIRRYYKHHNRWERIHRKIFGQMVPQWYTPKKRKRRKLK